MSISDSLVQAMHLPPDSDTVHRIHESGLAIANVGRDLAVIAETLVKTPISVIAQTRKVIDPAAVVDGIPSDHNFAVFL